MRSSKLQPFAQQIHESLYFSLSKTLSSTSNINQLHKIHSILITSGLHRTVFFSGKLISKYAQLKHPHSSSLVFVNISPTNSVYLWNTIIRSMTHNGLFTEALNYYSKMRVLNIKRDTFTFPSVINACAGSGQSETAKVVHQHVVDLGFGSDLYIGNALIDMYARLCELDNARKVFDEMPKRDIVSWNSLVSGYSAHEEWGEGLETFYLSRTAGVMPDSFMVSSVLPACSGLGVVMEGEMVHGLSLKLGIDVETRVCNGLLSMYFKFNMLKECDRVFSETGIRDVITWNTVICGYSQACLYQESIKLFMEMLDKHKPDLLTVTSVLRACAHTGDLKAGRFVHNYMIVNRYECDMKASNILIDMYSKCGDLPTSRDIFNKMDSRDLTSWNAIINGIIKASHYEEALATFRAMKMDIKPDFVTYVTLLSMCTFLKNIKLAKELHCETVKTGFNSSLIVRNAIVDVYAKCDNMEDALNQFENMKDRDIVSWNTIISACSHSQEYNLGFGMINRMRIEGGVSPNMATVLCMLPLCSSLGAKRQGKEIHGCVLKSGFTSNVPISNALIEMYSKCGNLRSSHLVFKHMKTRDVVTWTALIYAYGMYGHGMMAVTSFEDMKATGIIPDKIAFLAVIFACSHSGLVEQGRFYFTQMKQDYNMDPKIEHYACVVDLLARSGRSTEAEKFILSMPIKPDASIWGSLLSACRASGQTEVAERASKHIIKLNSENTGYYILVSNVYASLGKWDQVRMVRKSIKSKGLKKDAGKSWVEIDKKIYAFSSGDKFFEQYEEVRKLLEVLYDLIAKEGYVANLKSVYHDVNEDEKRDILCGHSERLAIAFGLLNTKPGTPLQVMKNLRVCEDCHTVTKYISKIVQREFLVRDANRFHLFKNGSCSCGDYW